MLCLPEVLPVNEDFVLHPVCLISVEQVFRDFALDVLFFGVTGNSRPTTVMRSFQFRLDG